MIIDASQLAQQRLGDLAVCGDDDFASLRVDHVERDFLSEQDVRERLGELFVQLFLFLEVIVFDRLGLLLRLDRRELQAADFFPRGNFHVHHDAVGAGGHGERGVLHVRGLLAEDGAQEALLWGEFGLGLGRDFSAEDVARLHLGADADDAVGSEVHERLFGDVRNVAGDFLRAELRVARADLEVINVDGRVHVLLHDALGDDDGVLEVVTVPRHERHEHVAAEGEFALVGVRAVGDDRAFLHVLALVDDRLLVDARARIRAHEFPQLVHLHAVLGIVLELLRVRHFAVFGENDLIRGDAGDLAGDFCKDDRLRVARHFSLDAGADDRRIGNEERHTLALHVRAHECAVRVVVLEEGDEPCCDGDELLRRDVHVVHLLRLDFDEVATVTDADLLFEQLAAVAHLGIRLRNDEVLLLVAREEVNLVGHLAVRDLAVWGLDEAEIIDARIGAHRGDEADVRTFRCLDGADAAVVRRMNVTDFEACAVARETSWPEGGKAALVREFAQRVRLIHELREL